MALHWTKISELYERVYTAKGNRATYTIDLDQSADRWVIHVNGHKCVDDIYFVTNAKKIVALFDASGTFSIPSGLRQPTGGEHPRIIAGDGRLDSGE
jgi:hypothetical protein